MGEYYVGHYIDFVLAKGVKNSSCYKSIGIGKATWYRNKKARWVTEYMYLKYLNLALEYG